MTDQDNPVNDSSHPRSPLYIDSDAIIEIITAILVGALRHGRAANERAACGVRHVVWAGPSDTPTYVGHV